MLIRLGVCFLAFIYSFIIFAANAGEDRYFDPHKLPSCKRVHNNIAMIYEDNKHLIKCYKSESGWICPDPNNNRQIESLREQFPMEQFSCPKVIYNFEQELAQYLNLHSIKFRPNILLEVITCW